jgi:type I restriction enzyme, S subunit
MKDRANQSDADMFPKDWDVKPLSELITEFRGGAALRPSDFTTIGVKVIPKGAVGPSGWLRIDDDDLQYCSPSYAAAHRNNQVDRSYTIVVLRDLVPTGPNIGLIVQIRQTGTFVLAQGVYGFKVNHQAEPSYLVQLSNTRWYRQLMHSIMVGSTQVHITNTAFKNVRIPLPEAAEQLVIAGVLSDVEVLLETLDRLIVKKRDLKQAAMQQLLTGQTRPPGFDGKWEVKAVAEIASLLKGTQLHSNEANPDGLFPHFNGGVSPSSYTDKSNTPANTIAISEGGNSCGYVQFVPQPFWCGGHCYAVMPKNIDNQFLYHALKARQIALMGLRVGSGLPNIQKTALGAFKLNVPSQRDEQTAIAEVLTDMDADLAALEQQREKTRELKRAMSQELLSGKTRLR